MSCTARALLSTFRDSVRRVAGGWPQHRPRRSLIRLATQTGPAQDSAAGLSRWAPRARWAPARLRNRSGQAQLARFCPAWTAPGSQRLPADLVDAPSSGASLERRTKQTMCRSGKLSAASVTTRGYYLTLGVTLARRGSLGPAGREPIVSSPRRPVGTDPSPTARRAPRVTEQPLCRVGGDHLRAAPSLAWGRSQDS